MTNDMKSSTDTTNNSKMHHTYPRYDHNRKTRRNLAKRQRKIDVAPNRRKFEKKSERSEAYVTHRVNVQEAWDKAHPVEDKNETPSVNE